MLSCSLRKGTTLNCRNVPQPPLWRMDEPELKIIDVLIRKLRKKLANASEGRNFIETVAAAAEAARAARGRRAHSRLGFRV